jgi:hypothetical protein
MAKQKLKRKQPRSRTTPLGLRADNGERMVVMVDEEVRTQGWLRSGRTTAFLVLSPDLVVKVGSRCVNKRRVTVIKIESSFFATHTIGE